MKIPAVYELFVTPEFHRKYRPMYYRLGETGFYVATFRRERKNLVGESVALFRIGFVEEESGFLEPARKAYQKALAVDPLNKAAAEALERLSGK